MEDKGYAQQWLAAIRLTNLPAAGRYGLSAFVILIIFCNLSAASRFGRANKFTAKPADGILLPVKQQAGSVLRHAGPNRKKFEGFAEI